MAGLNNLLSDTQQTQTTLPSWYDQAQQQIVSQGTQAAAAAPTFGQTTQQNAVNTLQGGANPFTQAQGTLQQISSGAANPWITDASGNVTPNTATAMGGLFQAENQQLNQLLPTTTAPAQAMGIGSGNFGSLRGQTAVDKAKADAFANLTAQQMQAALTNQQTGQAAAANLGNVGQQGISANMNVGQAQQNAPFQNVGNLASLLGTLQAPTTVSSQKQLSPLGQITSIGNTLQGGLTALGNTAAGAALLNSLGLNKPAGTTTAAGGATKPGGTTGGGGSIPGTIIPGGSWAPNPGDVAGQGQTTVPLPVDPSWGAPVQGTGANGGAGAGQILGEDGNVYTDPSYGTEATGGLDTGIYGPTPEGGNISQDNLVNEANNYTPDYTDPTQAMTDAGFTLDSSGDWVME